MLGCKEQILPVSFCVVRSKEVWLSLAISTEDHKKTCCLQNGEAQVSAASPFLRGCSLFRWFPSMSDVLNGGIKCHLGE